MTTTDTQKPTRELKIGGYYQSPIGFIKVLSVTEDGFVGAQILTADPMLQMTRHTCLTGQETPHCMRGDIHPLTQEQIPQLLVEDVGDQLEGDNLAYLQKVALDYFRHFFNAEDLRPFVEIIMIEKECEI